MKNFCILLPISVLTLCGSCASMRDAYPVAQESRWNISGSSSAHDPTCIYADGAYWLFYTAYGIGIKRSEDGTLWAQQGQVFKTKLGWWSDYVPDKADFNIWAPNVAYYDGAYYLFYSVSTMGSRISCIGLASTKDLKSNQWEDLGLVIASSWTTLYNCIDPSFMVADGKPYLAFGSWFEGIYLVELDPFTLKPAGQPVQIADRGLQENAIEGASIWNPGNGYYYLFASYDKCCAGVGSTYNIRYGRSKSIRGPYLDRKGRSMTEGGGTLLIGTQDTHVGPGGEDVFKTAQGTWAMCYHYYDAANHGRPKLAINTLSLSPSEWPRL